MSYTDMSNFEGSQMIVNFLGSDNTYCPYCDEEEFEAPISYHWREQYFICFCCNRKSGPINIFSPTTPKVELRYILQ